MLYYSGFGDITSGVQVVDINLGLHNFGTSGCEAADFTGFLAGNTALLQRGTCTFEKKRATNAAAAGAAGVLVFQSGGPDGLDLFDGTLSEGNLAGLMVFSLSYDLWVMLSNTPNLVLRMGASLNDPGVRPVPTPATLPLLALALLAPVPTHAGADESHYFVSCRREGQRSRVASLVTCRRSP